MKNANTMSEKWGHAWSDGVWSVRDLGDIAKSYLDAVEHEKVHEYSRELSVPRTIGAFIIDHKSAVQSMPYLQSEGYYQLDRANVPNWAHIAVYHLDRKRKHEDDKTWDTIHRLEPKANQSNWISVMISKIDSLPEGWSPIIPGYSYLAFVSTFWPELKNKKRKERTYAYYFTIDTSGRLAPCRHLEEKYTHLNTRFSSREQARENRAGRSRRGSQRCGQSFITHQWEVEKYWIEPFQKGRASYGEVVAMAVNFAMTIDNHWNLSVHRKTSRHRKYPLTCNLIINETLVKRLFRNRDKVERVMTKGGKRRPILHWARAHYRRNFEQPTSWAKRLFYRLFPYFRKVRSVSTVKTHLRGLTSFVLDGAQCRLILPGLHRITNTGWNIKWIDGIDGEVRDDLLKDGDQAVEESLIASKKTKDRWYIPAAWKKVA